MSQVLILFAVIGLLLVMLQLRGMLSFVFARYGARRLPSATPPPPATAALFAAAHTELTALGFEGPLWFLREPDNAHGDISFRVTAVYSHPASHALMVLGGMPAFHAPDRLNAYAVSRLEDGRHAITQAFDGYFSAVAGSDLYAKAVAPATLTAHYQAHLGAVLDLPSCADPMFATPEAIQVFFETWPNAQRDALLARRALWQDRHGVARPRLMLALRMLVAMWRTPKPAPGKQPIDPARLALLARAIERVRERVPAARTQWLLFGASAVLFAVAGAFVWGPQFSLMLLGVIGLHELGHYVAMRAFGYRNVHMLALPLVGGVTIGHESKPSAARRAWMSLMGPLPGIVLGWAILLWGALVDPTSLSGWRLQLATMLLTLNYMNLLPIPPLDGGRVVQAMLPPRWHGVQAGFVAVACVGGGIAALWSGMTMITVIMFLQLNGLRPLWQNGRVLKAMRADGTTPSNSRQIRLRRVFETFERVVGPALAAKGRITQAEAVLQSAEQLPMGWFQRTLLTLVMGVVLVIPLSALTLWWLGHPMSRESATRTMAMAEQSERDYDEITQRAPTLPFDALIAGLRGSEAPRAGASDDELRRTEARLQQPLPQEIAAVLRISDGVPAVGLGSVEQIGPPERAQIQPDAAADAIEVWADGLAKMTHVPVARALTWLRISAPPASDDDMAVYYDAGEAPAIPGRRVIEVSEGEGRAYVGLRALMEERWIAKELGARSLKRANAALEIARADLRSATTGRLLAQLPQPTLFESLLLRGAAPPAAATAAQLDAAAQRVGLPLPADLVELYRLHDGLREPALLPVERIEPVHVAPPERDLQLLSLADEPFEAFDSNAQAAGQVRLDASDVERCFVFGASWQADRRGGATELWCPARDGVPERWVSLRLHAVYPTFHVWLLDQAARVDAAQGAF